MSSVGLAMIVKNSEDVLDICLRSISGLFEQVVIVDTGSTDRSIEIAHSHGAEVHHFEWVYDFSAARNFSFDQLKTEWAFWMDSDDILFGRENFDILFKKTQEAGVDAALLEYFYSFDPVGEKLLAQIEEGIVSGQVPFAQAEPALRQRLMTTQHRERLVRRHPNWRWIYPVHEALPVAGLRVAKFEDVKIIHRRHVRDRSSHIGRNIEILKRVPEDKRDERVYFYFGLEYATSGKPDEALKAFEKYISLSTLPEEKYLVHCYVSDLQRQLGNLDSAEQYAIKAVGMYPNWRDAYTCLLSISTAKQDWKKAYYYGSMAKISEIPDTPFAYNHLKEEIGWVPEFIQACFHMGLYEEGIKECQRSLTHVPEDQSTLSNLDIFRILQNNESGARSVAEAVEFLLRNDDAETAILLIGRTVAALKDNPHMGGLAAVAGALSRAAVAGEIIPEPAKLAPGQVTPKDSDAFAVDPRVIWLKQQLNKRPNVRDLLVIGGPREVPQYFSEHGITGTQLYNINMIADTKVHSGAILWNCLERVTRPEALVASVRSKVAPGGDLFAFVANGPSKRGLAPPSASYTRLRAYDVDGFRKVMGTVRMPEGSQQWSAEAGDLALVIPFAVASPRSRTIAIICTSAPEPWGPPSLGQGIGGSEEAVIRLSRAFARRGHIVRVYGSGYEGPDDGDLTRTIRYLPILQYEPADILLGWRYPEVFSNQFRPFEATWRGLWLHDSIEPPRVAQAIPFIDVVWTISYYHSTLYQGLDKIYVGRNGIDPQEFWQIDRIGTDLPPNLDLPPRNPYKCVYVSSPFRGLGVLLSQFWPAIKQREPRAELHCYYGWESADRLGATSTEQGKAFKQTIMDLCKHDGVVWHGRIGQPDLYRELLSAGVWTYPTTWKEEHCISAYLAQAAGAWPVVFPEGALPQSVVFGWKTTPQSYVEATLNAMNTEVGRREMMDWTRRWTSWNDVACMWERLWLGMEA